LNNPHPDVIFMDHMMPGMDGLETTRAISSNTATSSIPVLMYTSKEGPEYEDEMLGCGAYGMLGKPAKPERLQQVLEELSAKIDAAQQEPIRTEPEVETADPVTEAIKVEEEEAMSKELIEEVSAQVVARALQNAMQPLTESIQRLESHLTESQSEIRKLNARQASNVSMVTQPVLDASLKQTIVQLQSQISHEVRSLREMMDQRADLAPDTLQKIKDLAIQAANDTAGQVAEKTSISAAEAVAAKIGAAQAQIQVQQEVEPFIAQAKRANLVSIIAIIAAATAITINFFAK
jgi:CheY-like chemotaxis protein